MPEPPILELRNISKAFPGVQALRNAALSVERGEVHALLGGNGAGKSTLVNIIAGRFPPDEGEILIDGQVVRLNQPRDSIAQGISVIYQELVLVPELSVAENIFLGRLPKKNGTMVDWRRLESQAADALGRLGLDIDPGALVSRLSTGAQQQVEIARAITANPKILIMDEPTSALTEHEVERLFQVVRVLKAQGITVIFISHHLDEVWEITDRMTVLRDGTVVMTELTPDVSAATLAEAIVGHEVPAIRARTSQRQKEEALAVDGVFNDRLRDVSLTLNKGEVVGLAGALGAGRTEIFNAIYGIDPVQSGEIRLSGRPIAPAGPADAIREGIYLVPEDRKGAGLILNMSVVDNITLPYLSDVSAAGFVARGRQAGVARRMVDQLGIKTPGVRQRLVNLSGGNQQKTVLARWMSMEPKVLLLDQSTRGLDIQAKEEVYSLVRGLAERGVAILFAATELAEFIQVCDRLYVIRDGEIVREFPSAAACTEKEILLASIADDDVAHDA